jgi:hypothetical protein
MEETMIMTQKGERLLELLKEGKTLSEAHNIIQLEYSSADRPTYKIQ